MKYQYIVIVIFFTFFSSNVSGQYNYQQMDNSYGLSNSCINDIYRDTDNLIWFATWDGLNYYDGNTIHVFNYEKSEINSNSISSNVIYKISEDRKRNIWIGTVEGVSRFNKNTGQFSNYFYNHNQALSNGYTLAINSVGKVYAARISTGQVMEYNDKTDSFIPLHLALPGGSMIIKILFDENNNLWVQLSNGSILTYQDDRGKFDHLLSQTIKNADNIFNCNHRIFYTTKSDELFSVSSNYLCAKILVLPHEVRQIGFYQNHYLFAWSSKGIGEYDTSFKFVNLLSVSIPMLRNVRVTSLMANEDNQLWIGTDGNGVIKASRKENFFGIVKEQANGQPFHIPVRAFSEINDELWIGTKGNGIITLKNWDKNNVSFSGIESFHTNVELLDNCVYSIVKGQDGLVYIGSDAPGVTLYDVKNRIFIKWTDIPGSKLYSTFGSVHCILYDRDSSVWLGLNDDGLIHLKLKKDKNEKLHLDYLYQYKYNAGTPESDKGPGNNVIYSLANGPGNHLWIGCRYGGLTLFDKQTKKFKTIKAFSYDGSLSNNDVLSLYVDHRKNLWVGTSFGLNWIPEEKLSFQRKPVFKKLYVDNGLPNNTIHAVTEDNSGNIWVSTNKGLGKINPVTLKVVQYKESDGLQSDEFSDDAVWKSNAGLLFFGGIYGFNYFQPQKINIHNTLPRLLLTDLQFAGKTDHKSGMIVLTKDGAVSVHNFKLKPDENYFELNLDPITYADAQKCQYAYMLDGADKEWHYVENHDKIIYNQLAPGTYTLRIKWSNGEGVWTTGVTAFQVTVSQYFWLSPFAITLYGLLLIAAGYIYFRYRKNKFLMRQELKMEHMLREKDETHHQEQLNFFTNIAHELQTPLTLILGSLERYLFKNKSEKQNQQGDNFLSIIKEEASRLHYLIQQLLEFRKAEAGYLGNHYSFINVSLLLANIAGLFSTMVDEKQLDFSWNIEPDIQLWTDRDKLEKIIFNLISNAFKYTDSKQYIMLSVNTLSDMDRLEIVVANSGCNLAGDEIEHLFDRFFVADGKQSKKSGTGIGLAFTHQMVSLLDGSINVDVENNWISFKVLLPLTFVPSQKNQIPDQGEKVNSASYLVRAMTSAKKIIPLTPIADNNKSSLIKSLEQEHKKSVLLVEDDQLIRYLLKDILGDTYILYEAESGIDALQVIKRSVPDIIISDVMMPDMDGLELCNIIKNADETCHIPFILLSARSAIEHKTEGYSSGADAYISKPFQTEHLLVRVQKLLEYRSRMHKLFSREDSVISTGLVMELDEHDRNFIKRVTKLIEENIENELDSEFLEKSLNLSRMQLYRKVKVCSDMSPSELIRHIRLEKASALLKNTNLTVLEIFYATGFNNKTYFFREFKKRFDCSPNDYRYAHRLPDLNKN
jgi:signal transduction histidine kinase/ligand-binding sensor domain-containing protein/CheY-like chemotaxis protein/AraC-like DNA-binding protein